MATDLVAFLRARLDEDEADARACDMWPAPWSYRPNGYSQTVWSSNPGVSSVAVCDWAKPARHIARWDPARVLAEVEAKRWIVDWFDPIEHPVGTLLALAQVYADHPDFDPGWRLDRDR